MATASPDRVACQALAGIFEEFGLLLPDPEPSKAQRAAPLAAGLRVVFYGPRRGELRLDIHGVTLLGELARNLLGLAEIPDAELQRDALRELGNVLCGNLLPRLTDGESKFVIAPQECGPVPQAAPLMDRAQAKAEIGVGDGRALVAVLLEG